MGRKRRICAQRLIYHIINRCVQRKFLFSSESFPIILGIIRRAKQKYDFKLYGFTLMHNHYHLIIATRRDAISNIMQSIDQQIAWKINRQLGTRGHLWEKRYTDCLIETDRYLLEVLAYIHLNPVRAGLVERAEDYPWSSYRSYVQEDAFSDLIDFPDWYRELSKVAERRRRRMREFTEGKNANHDNSRPMSARRPELSEPIFYGSPKFIDAMEHQYASALTPLRRPRRRARREKAAPKRKRKSRTA